MKRFMLTTTALVCAGGMAAADVALKGAAEMGVSGAKGKDAKLHKEIDVNFTLSGATDTGLTFGASIDLDEAKTGDEYKENGHVYISGAFGTLTLGDTDSAYDVALAEADAGGALAADHTSHDGFESNAGLKNFSGTKGHGLRYDYTLGTITASLSGEFGAEDSSNSALGVGVAWSGDIGGVGMGVGIGYQTGEMGAKEASIAGASVSVDLGNGISAVLNASNRDDSEGAASTDTTQTGIGVAYTAGPLTVAVNGGQKSMKGAAPGKASGAGFSAVYNLGTGVDFKVGAGSGKKNGVKDGSWSAGLAFSF